MSLGGNVHKNTFLRKKKVGRHRFPPLTHSIIHAQPTLHTLSPSTLYSGENALLSHACLSPSAVSPYPEDQRKSFTTMSHNQRVLQGLSYCESCVRSHFTGEPEHSWLKRHIQAGTQTLPTKGKGNLYR